MFSLAGFALPVSLQIKHSKLFTCLSQQLVLSSSICIIFVPLTYDKSYLITHLKSEVGASFLFMTVHTSRGGAWLNPASQKRLVVHWPQYPFSQNCWARPLRSSQTRIWPGVLHDPNLAPIGTQRLNRMPDAPVGSSVVLNPSSQFICAPLPHTPNSSPSQARVARPPQTLHICRHCGFLVFSPDSTKLLFAHLSILQFSSSAHMA